MNPLVHLPEIEEEVLGVEGGDVEEDHFLLGLDAKEGVGGQKVALSRDGGSLGDSYVEHHYSQYHEHDAWLGTSNILDNISNIFESIKASSGNFFTGVKASSDEHFFD